MRTSVAHRFLIGLLLQVTVIAAAAERPKEEPRILAPQKAPTSQPAATDRAADEAVGPLGKGSAMAAFDKKLLGTWAGGPCVGNYTFKSDGSYELRNFTPGDNSLNGTWTLRWDALPPTLVLKCTTSDFKSKDRARDEYFYFGKALEIKLIEMNDEAIVLRFPADKQAGIEDGYSEKYERCIEKSNLQRRD